MPLFNMWIEWRFYLVKITESGTPNLKENKADNLQNFKFDIWCILAGSFGVSLVIERRGIWEYAWAPYDKNSYLRLQSVGICLHRKLS